MMTRKHFTELANIISLENDLTNEKPELNLLYRLASDIAVMCKEENPRFNKSKFMEACGFDDG